MTTGKYIAWLICCAFLIVFLVSTGVYLVLCDHAGWSLFPFIMACFIGDASSLSDEEDDKKDKQNKNDKE